MSAMPPIATKNGEALNARGKSRGTPARVLSFATSTRVALLESFLRGDEVASLATVAAAEPLK
jgi:hypothetical protein